MIDLYRFLPSFWIQTKKTFAPWDRALNMALDEYPVTEIGAHTARVGPFVVWTSNYPYSFGYNQADALEGLPRCRTRLRLRRAIQKAQERDYAKIVEDHRG